MELYNNLSLDKAINRAARAAITMTQNFGKTDQLCDVPLLTAIHTGQPKAVMLLYVVCTVYSLYRLTDVWICGQQHFILCCYGQDTGNTT